MGFLIFLFFAFIYLFFGGVVGAITLKRSETSCEKYNHRNCEHFGWAIAGGAFWPFTIPLMLGARLVNRKDDDE